MRFDDMEEPEVDDLHKQTFYEIIWIEKGKSRQVIDYVDYEISPGSLFFISPGQVHQLKRDKDSSGSIIIFSRFRVLDFFWLEEEY